MFIRHRLLKLSFIVYIMYITKKRIYKSNRRMRFRDQMIIENGSGSLARSSKFGDLMGKKSVRAAFKLRPEAAETLSVLAAQLGIKQKSLLDSLMEDEDALRAIAESLPADNPGKGPTRSKDVCCQLQIADHTGGCRQTLPGITR